MRLNKKLAKPAAHDPAYPDAFVDFMMQKWRQPGKRMPAKVRHLQHFQARRRALSQAFAGETLIIPTGREKVRANDTFFRFRPGSDFYYLTGNTEPDCVLVLKPRRGGGHDSVLYAEPNPGRSDPTFFADRNKGELWVGPRLGLDQSKTRYGVTQCLALADLPAYLQSLRSGAVHPHRLVRGIDSSLDDLVGRASERDQALAAFLSEMRLIKDETEIKILQRACASTRRGFDDIIARLPTAKSEREVEGVFNLRARMEGNDVGYNTIAAAGAHACILHWHHNDGAIKRGELLLVDAGVESQELYTADVTRTFPISGTFSKPQRQIYDLVIAAQHAAFKAVKPGNAFLDPYYAAMKVLAAGLETLGILPMPAAEALHKDHQYFKRYTLHGVSHMLGLDVHDCAQARNEMYRYAQLKTGMVLTVEPGLYFQPDDLTVPARYRGIGVRIEDDVVVTPKGYRILSNLPRRSQEVEAWMRAIWKRGQRTQH